MAWTMKMRMTSMAVTIYLALAEYLLVAIPIGITMWFAGAHPARVLSVGVALAALWALVIVLLSNVRPLSIRAGARDGDRA